MSWGGDWIALQGALRRARKAADLRQAGVAAKLGISVRHFARLEGGEIDPQSRILFAWAHAVGLRITAEDRPDMSGSERAQT